MIKITKKEVIIMNVARNCSMDYPYVYKSRISNKTKKADIITLVSNKDLEDKKVTLEYLNEKLAYFYNNGGPIMDI
jgi:hypothetical protein